MIHPMTVSTGTLIDLPIVLASALAALIGGTYLVRLRSRVDEIDAPLVFWGGIGCFVLAAGLVIGAAIGMWPYDAEYHEWRTTSGKVKETNSRLVGAGEGMEQRFVVTFADGRQRACDDTRCSTVKAGDTLTLKCKRAYQWGATPGYDCNWISNEPAGQS